MTISKKETNVPRKLRFVNTETKGVHYLLVINFQHTKVICKDKKQLEGKTYLKNPHDLNGVSSHCKSNAGYTDQNFPSSQTIT